MPADALAPDIIWYKEDLKMASEIYKNNATFLQVVRIQFLGVLHHHVI